jgi:hypothetical protein
MRNESSHDVLRAPVGSIAHSELERLARPVRARIGYEVLASGFVDVLDTNDQRGGGRSDGLIACQGTQEQSPHVDGGYSTTDLCVARGFA